MALIDDVRATCDALAESGWRDLLLQVTGENDYYGYGDETVVANRAEAEHAVTTIASLFPGARVAERKSA